MSGRSMAPRRCVAVPPVLLAGWLSRWGSAHGRGYILQGARSHADVLAEASQTHRIFERETGRTRLVKGSGEIVEEIVSKSKQVRALCLSFPPQPPYLALPPQPCATAWAVWLANPTVLFKKRAVLLSECNPQESIRKRASMTRGGVPRLGAGADGYTGKDKFPTQHPWFGMK